jgi:hypothetical protein
MRNTFQFPSRTHGINNHNLRNVNYQCYDDTATHNLIQLDLYNYIAI